MTANDSGSDYVTYPEAITTECFECEDQAVNVCNGCQQTLCEPCESAHQEFGCMVYAELEQEMNSAELETEDEDDDDSEDADSDELPDYPMEPAEIVF